MKTYIMYNNNCTDSFGEAYAARQKNSDNVVCMSRYYEEQIPRTELNNNFNDISKNTADINSL